MFSFISSPSSFSYPPRNFCVNHVSLVFVLTSEMCLLSVLLPCVRILLLCILFGIRYPTSRIAFCTQAHVEFEGSGSLPASGREVIEVRRPWEQGLPKKDATVSDSREAPTPAFSSDHPTISSNDPSVLPLFLTSLLETAQSGLCVRCSYGHFY